MEHNFHPFHELFEQLGLPSTPDAIREFIARHRPLPHDIPLHEAPFWTPAQAAFLREAIEADSDWAEVVDALNAALRE
jgi:hypothetical protein